MWGNSCSLGAGRGNKSAVWVFLRAVLEICLFSVILGDQGFADPISEVKESIFSGLCSRVSTLFIFSLSLITGGWEAGRSAVGTNTVSSWISREHYMLFLSAGNLLMSLALKSDGIKSKLAISFADHNLLKSSVLPFKLPSFFSKPPHVFYHKALLKKIFFFSVCIKQDNNVLFLELGSEMLQQ